MSLKQSPGWSSGNNTQRLFQNLDQNKIEGFDCKIDGRAVGAELRHSLGGSDWRIQTQGVSESAAVSAGRDRFALRDVLPLIRY